MTGNFHVSDHPLVQHKLTHMRKRKEDLRSREFVRLMREMGMLMAYEVTADIKLPAEKRINTETGGVTTGRTLGRQKPVIVPILRTGLIMAEGLQDVIPTTLTGHIGIQYQSRHQDPNENPIDYLVTLPDDIRDRHFIIVDPVVATGVTACRAISMLREFEIKSENIRFVTILVTRVAKQRLIKEHEGVTVYCASDEEELLDGTRVLNGLGYVSERLYRTN